MEGGLPMKKIVTSIFLAATLLVAGLAPQTAHAASQPIVVTGKVTDQGQPVVCIQVIDMHGIPEYGWVAAFWYANADIRADNFAAKKHHHFTCLFQRQQGRRGADQRVD